MASKELQKYFFPNLSETEDQFFPNLSRFLEVSHTPLFSNIPQVLNDISISETDKTVDIEVPLPGLNSDEIDLTFQKGMLQIRGNKKEEKHDPSRKIYTKASRSYLYRVPVPGNIQEGVDPKAELKNGIMKITFQKQKTDAPKRIQIKNG